MAPFVPDVSSFIYGLPLEAAYIKLDTAISQLETRLSSLKTLRNSLPPIAKIPTEIVSKTFQHLYDSSISPFCDDVNINSRFVVSWVCRHWRNTAIATPSLWSIISSKNMIKPLNLHLVEELLVRSGDRALAISLSKPSTEVLTACLSQLVRIQHLRLFSTPSNDDLNRLSSQPAPLLVSLELQDLRYSLPFLGIHPRLRHLTILNYAIILPSALFTPTLTSLQLTVNFPFTIDHLANALSALHNLRELSLSGVFRPNPLPILQQECTLPNLQVVTFFDLGSETPFNFFNHLRIPQAAISLVWSQELDCDDLERVASEFNSYRSQIPFDIHHLEIDDSRTLAGISYHVCDKDRQHRYSFRFPVGAIQREEVRYYVEAFCSKLSLQDLASLSTDSFGEFISQDSDFPKLPNLKTVNLTGHRALGTFLGNFALNVHTGQCEPFPPIKDMLISDINVDKWDQYLTPDLQPLHQILAAQKSAGIGLEKLIFTRCPNVDAELFRDLVDILSIVA